MTVFSCERNWEAMLTCIYDAWASKLGHKNIRLMLEPIEQYTLFDEYIHVEPDYAKAESVMDAINMKISPMVYKELLYESMAYEDDVLQNIYLVLILGFAYGPNVLDMVSYEPVMRSAEIRKRLDNEAHKFVEFLRFHEIRKSVYVAHIEPKSHVLLTVAEAFSDRMPSEYWMVVDDVHKEAVVHPKDEDYYIRKLTDEEFERLLETEKENDEYTDLWKTFFNSIAIKERENYRCQRNLFPLWTRKHAVEFMN